ncbi:hypothetical protein [Micromonospora noduli]|uniref:Phosphopantetheine adenylyltransferase n=1 Tax=Micromonospora noduli TaxID=709876 RepID=A0ABX9D3I3_9ACTN|nr:hypothetical protein [Micromonospora noduli]KAB1927728.1 hypothetical protein F8280_05730 [Micromonospora noduli]RAO08227.1 hypothetical protein GUI43_04207 [Micromonospora noduli]RAO21081.1 hypothetical protein MED15_02278 [Micromonospora noduli]RAO28183.1 hypothetical protein ONO86_06026 [Micromonospora noduli]RAO29204.1 hypothetical protein ONO23_04546 [Micromonospora noduli]
MKMRVILTIVGVITATPALALFWPQLLTSSYGLADPDRMTVALLQHRGVLQAALGAAIIWGAFHLPARVPAAATAIITKSVFLALTVVDVGMRADMNLISLVFDPIAIVILTIVIVLHFRQSVPTAAPA